MNEFCFLKIRFYLLNMLLIFSSMVCHTQTIIQNIPYIANSDTNTYKIERNKLDILYFKGLKNRPVVIFFHGGGLTQGEKYLPGGYRDLKYIEVAPNYRLSPKAKCPAYLEDAAEAIAWVWNNIEKYGGDKKKIIISGNSAGAYLTAMMAMDTTYLQKYNISTDDIWIYFTESAQLTTHFNIMAERGLSVGSDTKYRDKYAPLFYHRKLKSNVILATGDRTLDMAGRYEQNMEMYETLKKLGVNAQYWEFPGESHVTMGDKARAKLVDVLRNGTFLTLLPEKLNQDDTENISFSNNNYGSLYSITGIKIKDNPSLSDLKPGVPYIYKSKTNRCEKILKCP